MTGIERFDSQSGSRCTSCWFRTKTCLLSSYMMLRQSQMRQCNWHRQMKFDQKGRWCSQRPLYWFLQDPLLILLKFHTIHGAEYGSVRSCSTICSRAMSVGRMEVSKLRQSEAEEEAFVIFLPLPFFQINVVEKVIDVTFWNDITAFS